MVCVHACSGDDLLWFQCCDAKPQGNRKRRGQRRRRGTGGADRQTGKEAGKACLYGGKACGLCHGDTAWRRDGQSPAWRIYSVPPEQLFLFSGVGSGACSFWDASCILSAGADHSGVCYCDGFSAVHNYDHRRYGAEKGGCKASGRMASRAGDALLLLRADCIAFFRVDFCHVQDGFTSVRRAGRGRERGRDGGGNPLHGECGP